MKTRLAILGATGSIGRQALDVAAAHRDRFDVVGVSCREHLADCRGLAPGARIVATDRDGADEVLRLATADDVDLVVVGIPGFAALRPTLAALAAGKSVAIAAKEVLVVAGHLVRRAVPEGAGPRLRPIDGEHCALWQCLRGEERESVTRVVLTASGGAFRDVPLARLAEASVADALRHPTWRMGPKITIDSATLVNKAYEVIEAQWLFGLDRSRVDAVLHPESIVHGLVEFADGSVKAQLARTDMRLFIQYALLAPERLPNALGRLDLSQLDLSFRPIDRERYPCYRIVLDAAAAGAAARIAVNAADELAVARYLAGAIPFTGIARALERAASIAARSGLGPEPALEEIVAFDAEVRRMLGEVLVA